jgi:hypothetical protein
VTKIDFKGFTDFHVFNATEYEKHGSVISPVSLYCGVQTVAGLRLGKHIPAATVTHAKEKTEVLPTRSATRNYKEENWG